ncbi:UDP-N-acetylglucosamine 1-carboxyvinyltransferase [Caldalkalibacillus thermarum TA2.A1]|uniref:UDP-N-acetylglucosamine 1-carboxyvinyltransferase n=1 Tax=Caldalkalibacillus thermarum (strain TA2.A1) TaxID=986075 RepID=F5L706_CALTT|nr:UDP-N-acetylglucosamine 1-carboxyvinyltransferase [Caldalkalibacillus thermarum]EGL82894.1 UDP-N-acetylglucosamine 1-carboxyvinyltransferase [Caldalkalibacillus thermarum TA2.A1]QZT34193.1 UDP-N-acetylglucosamine 1-carboxyvinyltransferase [Caldalkalibacillus thermarum TA2.A1]
MENIVIEGGTPLKGRVQISGAKNSAVALIPATILAESETVIDNVPNIRDVHILIELLKEIGGQVRLQGGELTVDTSRIKAVPLTNGRVKQLRASYYLMGAMLGRFKRASIGLPGGCNLGPRPIDQHIKGFEALGARVRTEKGAIHLEAERLRGARIYLDVVSVGATINIMLAAVKAEGQTIIENAAKEPEIVDVATLLSSMGAKIKGAGTDVIRIEGVKRLYGCRHSIIPDRIETGTFMIAAAASRGQVMVDQVIPKHVEALSSKLREMGVKVIEADEHIIVDATQSTLKAVDIKTLVHPGFPTDLQQPMTTLLTQAEGTSIVTDTIYSSRFKQVDELRRMGANIKVEGRSAIINGPTPLTGAKVTATDLRAGAALVIAGIIASGLTEISGVEHIERGYEQLEAKFKGLGAHIWRQSREGQVPLYRVK